MRWTVINDMTYCVGLYKYIQPYKIYTGTKYKYTCLTLKIPTNCNQIFNFPEGGGVQTPLTPLDPLLK
jgi:hypothetical protein